jgi:TP901 family phage tail tape measure protein
MASIAKLLVTVGADVSDFETDMKRASRISDREMRKMERQAKQLNDKWNRNFKMAGVAVAAGLAIATKAAADFEKAMAEVSTLLEDTSGMDALGDSVKRMSVEFGQAPVDQAKALYQIISAGASDAATQMEHLEAANRLAVGGVTDVATAADGLTTVLNAYEGSGMSATDVSDILFQTMRNGKTTIGELAGSIGNVATIAAQTGVGFDQLGAAVGTLTKKGINTSQAMDAIRGVLSAVLKQSDQSVKMADELGVAFNATALEAKGLHGFLADIAASGATSEQLSKLFGRVEGLNAVMALGSANGAEFTEQLESMGDVAGQSEAAVAKMADTTAFKVAQATAAFETLKIEIGQRFLSAVSGAATKFVEYFDAVVKVIENLVALLTARLAIAGVAAIKSATVAARGMATAMAIAGGPIGILAAGVALLVVNFDDLVRMDNPLGAFIRRLSQGFIMIAGVVQMLAIELSNLIKLIFGLIRSAAAPLTALVTTLAEATAQIKAGNFVAAKQAVTDYFNTVKQEAGEGQAALVDAFNDIGKGWDAFDAAAARSTKLFKEWSGAGKDAADEFAEGFKDVDDFIDSVIESLEDFDKTQKKSEAQIKKTNAALEEHAEWVDEIDQIINDSIDVYDDWSDAQERAEERLQGLIDAALPLESALRDLGDNVDFVHSQLAAGNLTVEEAAAVLEHLAEQYGKVVQEQQKVTKSTDIMATVIDEGARILTRAFSDMWSGMLDGSFDAFDQIKDGFKALLADLTHQATTQKIVVGFSTAAGQQGSYFSQSGSFNWGQFGTDLANTLGIIIGTKLGGGGEYAAVGSQLGALVGSAIPGLGTVVGGLVGSILGGLFGGLFDSDGKLVLEASGSSNIWSESRSDNDTFADTVFGRTFLRSRRVDAAALDEFSDQLEDFDKTLASFMTDSEIERVSQALNSWSDQVKGKSLSIEQLFESRFYAVLGTFEKVIQDFAAAGGDLEEQIERFGVAMITSDLMDDNPGVFGERELAEVLAIVESFQTGVKTIGEAFEDFAEAFDKIVQAQAVLDQYAGTSASETFAEILRREGMSLAETTVELQSMLGEAIAGFDGSPEQLQYIAELAYNAREGEILLLQQIDAIQKGLNANLESLKADLLGITQDKNAGALFREAFNLLESVGQATSIEQVDAIAREFESLIRAISPEDAERLGVNELVNLVDEFQALANAAIEGFRADAEANAESTRELVDVFRDDIGDPLDILANSNQIVADELGNIDDSIQNLGPPIENSIRSGFAGANVNVTVVIDEPGLVNE